MSVTAVVRGDILIVKGIRPMLERLQRRDYHADANSAADDYYERNDRPQGNDSFRRIAISSLTDAATPYNDDDDGPNHKGTYSKAYTLKHPEVKWVHRGQGRYLPSNTVAYPAHFGSTPATKSNQTPRFPGRSSLRRRSGDVDMDADEGDNDEDDPPFNSQPNFTSKRLSDASYSLRRRQSEAEPLTPGQLRAARLNRRSGQFGDDEDDEDEAAEDDSESGDDDDERTYSKEYKEAHPEHNWRHCGNGFYKKGAKQSLAPSTQGSRRDSNRSQIKTEPEFPEVRRYRLSELKNFPGEKPVHCGNGWYRFESSLQEGADQSAIESSDEEEEMAKNEKFSKEEMVKYLNTYPDAEFEHRGNGRYVLKSRVNKVYHTPTAKAPAESPGQTFSKAYVERHPNESFFHAGSGRYRRGSRPTRPSDASRKVEQPPAIDKAAIPTGLVNKEFVLSHPEMEFHHRGQGRYAYGPRPVETPVAPVPVKEPTPSPAVSDTELVDTAYVEAHPHETFHHRGQGRWARGLPPPGSSNKTAVRGPMASQAKFSVTPSNPPVDDLPGMDELLIRAEGPDKYPQVEWVYRGGGKWARTAKQKEPVAVKPTNTRGSRGKSLAKIQDLQGDSDESEEVVYTDDEYAATGGGSFNETPYGSRRASATTAQLRNDSAISRRQRGYLQQDTIDVASGQTSKNSSMKSKTTTPKPQRLTLEEDRLSDDDNFPSLYASAWPPPRTDEPFDDAAKLMRKIYKPLNPSDMFVNALTRKDPAIRPKEVLRATTSHVQKLLQQLQDEYLELDKITAPHARVPRKPVKGGRMPLDDAVHEDRKEADLYDYNYDPRKVGYQNPDAQKIIRDAEGRALRKRRQRNCIEVESAATPGGEEVPLGPRRAVKPVSRFDGIAPTTTRKKRTNNGIMKPASSMTPDPAASAPQPQVLSNGYVVRTSGRWKNHIPKRIRELRGDSVGASPANGTGTGTGAASGAASGAVSPGVEEGALRSETPGTSSDTPLTTDGKEGSPGAARKGRPKGSKNLHKRRDAGIPKGPRKPKVVPSIEGSVAAAAAASSSAAAAAARPSTEHAHVAYPGHMASREGRNDPWKRIGYPFD